MPNSSSLLPTSQPSASQSILLNAWRSTPGTFAERLSRGSWRLYRHLAELSIILALAVAGKYPRLIISMPPQHGKSELVSHWFPCWLLDLFPWLHIILASYESDYAAKWGRKVRNTIQANQDQLRVQISDDSAAANSWETTAGGGMNSTGANGAITGNPAHCFIIDDPVKNREQAESPTYRQKTWEWWTGTARERINPLPWAPYGVVILMATRWNLDDLTGRMLARKVDESDKYAIPWVEYKLPAIALENDPLGRRPGEALWPEKYPLELLLSIKSDISPYDWESEYQQSPILKSGSLFRREYFQPIEVLA